MNFALILFPFLTALIAFLYPSNKYRPFLLPLTGIGHLVITILFLSNPELGIKHDWIILDPVGKIILLSISVLYFFCAFYAVGYLRFRLDRSNRIFVVCMSTFLGGASLVIQSHHLGLMWIAMEATTLITAPLIYFNRTNKSIEATWKYLMVGSVGIALALLGTFFLAYAAMEAGFTATLSLDELLKIAPQLSKTWLRAGFILLLVGYGTKMGLAPMHSWKPDAYGESPGVVGAIFAGGVTSAAFLALLRIWQICQAAGEGEFISRLLLIMGLLSMAVAGLFMLGQRDFKRMLAYSSVEHMGILTLGLGLGKPGLYGVLLHVINNALTKGILFLSAGNIHRAFDSKNIDQVSGAIRRLPISGTMFLLGFLAITGSPPFAPFVSEFAILNTIVGSQNFFIAGLFLLLLLVVFIGMGKTVLKTTQGRIPSGISESKYKDSVLTVGPIIALLILVLLLGIVIPEPLKNLIDDAILFMEYPV